MEKEVFVIPRSKLIDAGLLPAEDTEGKAFYTRINSLGDLRRLVDVANTSGEYGKLYGKANVETNPSLQQVIMYGYGQRGDGRFLLYQRAGGNNYKEKRLAGKVSVGIGGHMEQADINLAQSLYRELDEEAQVFIDNEPVSFTSDQGKLNLPLMKKYLRISPIGFIKDERDAVGKVHFGVVCRIVPKAENIDICIRIEPGQENIRWQYVTPQEYIEMQEAEQINPEGWTDIVFQEEILRNSQEKTA